MPPHSPYKLNPDTKTVDRVVKGLVMRKIKFGYAYCPCRLVMGDAEKDKKIICPCVYHVEEIERDGECHCNLLWAIKRRTTEGLVDGSASLDPSYSLFLNS